MPFDPPATYDSIGTTGYLSEFAFSDGGSPPAYDTSVTEIKSFTFTPIEVPNVDFTHLKSRNNTRELRPGMIMPGKVEITFNLTGDTTQLDISTHAQGQDVISAQIRVPVQNRTKTMFFTCDVFVSSFKIGPMENDKPNEGNASFQIAGGYVMETE